MKNDITFNNINRVEVIDSEGRSYVNYLNTEETVDLSLQDNNKTLKLFIR